MFMYGMKSGCVINALVLVVIFLLGGWAASISQLWVYGEEPQMELLPSMVRPPSEQSSNRNVRMASYLASVCISLPLG